MKFLMFLTLAFLMNGCSSIQSSSASSDKEMEGLVYYMPKRDLLATVVVAGGRITGFSATTTSAYPDLAQKFLMTYPVNLLGKNTADITISNGMLSSAKSTTVSGIDDALKNLATSFGYGSGLKQLLPNGVPPSAAPDECKVDGVHVFRYPLDSVSVMPCGIVLKITVLGAKPNHVTKNVDAGSGRSGVFYRQNRAYSIEANGMGIDAASIAFAPSDEIYFLPIAKTFFANNEATFAFTDGVPTQYKQDADGELIGLLKLPADIIGAYFAAVGMVFDAFKNREDKETSASVSNLKLEMQRRKFDMCLLALKSGDDDLVTNLNCGA